jgi:hypothetical protein
MQMQMVPKIAKGFCSILAATTLSLTLSGCEALDLINSVGTVLAPSASGPPGSSPAPGLLQKLFSTPTPSQSPSATPTPIFLSQTAAITPTAAPVASKINVVKPLDPNPLSLDWNLVRIPNVGINVSSVLNPTYDKNRLIDGKLTTSWFAATDDSSSNNKLPTIEISFPQPVGIFGINLRGDRERSEGMQIQEISLLITSAQGVLISETITLPAQQTDYNLLLGKPVDAASSLRITITKSNLSKTPGLAEIEVVGRS